jgi:hypothetical protein
MKALWALALVAVAGCTSPNPTKHCSEGMCLNPDFPYCDAEGVVSGEPNTCIAVTCTPGEIRTCLGDDAFTCTASGDGYERVSCDLGCTATPAHHCKHIEPRYLPEVCDSPAAEEKLFVNGSTTIDPNDDSTCNGGVVPQAGAPAICVLRYRKITVTSDGQLKILGKVEPGLSLAGRAAALVADEDLSIEGVLDVSADGVINGPAGGLQISGGPVDIVNGPNFKAGGGAGGLTNGAAGGSMDSAGQGSSGGLAIADPVLTAVLFGGAAGGRHPNGTIGGGGGGGAATLISCKGKVAITGAVDAGGGGGQGGKGILGGDTPGWGGGAGGHVVLQATRIEVTGGIYANGGGGGTGMVTGFGPGLDGLDGLRSTTVGAPGHTSPNGGGPGGFGGANDFATPTVGGKPTVADASPGGGGGSVGFLQTYTPDGREPLLSEAKASPPFRPNVTLRTR